MKKLNLMLAVATILVSAPVLASGSGGGGYSGGGGGGNGGYNGGGADAFSSRPVDAATLAFNKGKKMFAKRVTCKKCSYNSGVTDGKTAKEVASKVKAGEFNLKADERTAILYYISQRYSIRT